MACGKKGCSNSGIKDSVLKEKFIEAYNEFIENRNFGNDENAAEIELKKLNAEENELVSLHVRGLISKHDYEHDKNDIQAKRKALEQKVRDYRQAHIRRGAAKPITEFDEELVGRVIKGVTIKDYVVTFEFYNGVTISRAYTNGPSGNRKGWKEKKQLKEAQMNGNSN